MDRPHWIIFILWVVELLAIAGFIFPESTEKLLGSRIVEPNLGKSLGKAAGPANPEYDRTFLERLTCVNS
jgi:hypothetical protein